MNLFEIQILKFISENLSCGALDAIFKFVSFIGNGGTIWIILAILMIIFPKTRKCGITLAVSLIGCLIFGNLLLKPIIARTRPFNVDPLLHITIKKPTDFSFPSGHTFSSFAGALTIKRHFKKSGTAALILASMIAFSRLYLTVHYPTDVIGGIILGTCLSFAAEAVCKKFIFKEETK